MISKWLLHIYRDYANVTVFAFFISTIAVSLHLKAFVEFQSWEKEERKYSNSQVNSQVVPLKPKQF